VDDVNKLLQEIYRSTGNGFLAVVKVEVHNGVSMWEEMSTQYYAVREGVPAALSELNPAWEWYFVPSLLGRQDRKKESVRHSGTLWVDFDADVDVSALDPQPSAVVRTSADRCHAYWFLEDVETTINLEHLNRKLAYTYAEGDHSGWDANQLLRLPWGVNAKHTPAYPVTLEVFEPRRRYVPDDFMHLRDHPSLLIEVSPEATAVPSPVTGPQRLVILERHRHLLTVRLDRMLNFQDRNDRSGALWWMWHELARLGIPMEDAYHLVRGTPNDKFSEQAYNGSEALWRDCVNGYAHANQASQGMGIIEELEAHRKSRDTGPTKMHKMGVALVNEMNRTGLFLQSDNPRRQYYLDDNDAHLYPLVRDDPETRKLFLDRYGVNAGGSEYQQLLEHCVSQAMNHPPVPVYRSAFFDKDTKTLYVNRYDNRMYRIDGTEIKLLNNGEDDVLFVSPPNATPWRADLNTTAKNPWEKYVFDCPNIVDQEGVTVREIHHILRTWLTAMFFRELMPVKPILFMHGEAGSGKTAAFKGINMTLLGPEVGVQDLPTEPDAYDLVVAMSDHVFFDNVDTWKPWLPDKLALTATQYSFMKRRLYTDSVILNYAVSCFIGLTARTPQFLRDDVAERIIPITVVPYAESGGLVNERTIAERITSHRSDLWGWLLKYLNTIVAHLREHGLPGFTGDFRLADFAAMLQVTCALDGVDLGKCLWFMKAGQATEAIADEPMVDVLKLWLEKEQNQNREVTPSMLHQDFSYYNNEEYRRRIKSPRGLATRIGQYQKYFPSAGIHFEKWGDPVKYRFRWLRTEEMVVTDDR
jgi:DNA primase RepB-like protein